MLKSFKNLTGVALPRRAILNFEAEFFVKVQVVGSLARICVGRFVGRSKKGAGGDVASKWPWQCRFMAKAARTQATARR